MRKAVRESYHHARKNNKRSLLTWNSPKHRIPCDLRNPRVVYTFATPRLVVRIPATDPPNISNFSKMALRSRKDYPNRSPQQQETADCNSPHRYQPYRPYSSCYNLNTKIITENDKKTDEFNAHFNIDMISWVACAGNWPKRSATVKSCELVIEMSAP